MNAHRVLAVAVAVQVVSVGAMAAVTGSEIGYGSTSAEACNFARRAASTSADSNYRIEAQLRNFKGQADISIGECGCSEAKQSGPNWLQQQRWSCSAAWGIKFPRN